MKYFINCLTWALFLLLFQCSANDTLDSELSSDFPESMSVIIHNNTELNRQDEAVVLSVKRLQEKQANFNANAFAAVCDGKEFPGQISAYDDDGNPEAIVVSVNFTPNQQQKLILRYAATGIKTRKYLKRTQAEISHRVGGHFEKRKYLGGEFKNVPYLRVPPEHTDHSGYIRYEGPGWESDRIGYRFYLDWRNAIDIFGKKKPDLMLQNVGQDGYDSYHEMSDWGMDVLKVGESLGIGSVGIWHENEAQRVSETDSITCEIAVNGPVKSTVRTVYYGWKAGANKCQLVSELSITAGSRMTKHDLQIIGTADNLCTGIVKSPDAELMVSGDGDMGWRYLATYGKQSLAGDHLGMAVLYDAASSMTITEDAYNHVVVLMPDDGRLTYYFLAAWEQETNGINTKEAFVNYLDGQVKKLNHPITVDY